MPGALPQLGPANLAGYPCEEACVTGFVGLLQGQERRRGRVGRRARKGRKVLGHRVLGHPEASHERPDGRALSRGQPRPRRGVGGQVDRCIVPLRREGDPREVSRPGVHFPTACHDTDPWGQTARAPSSRRAAPISAQGARVIARRRID